MKLSDRIRMIRIKRGLTQADVADRLGISSSAYGKMERNAKKASYETLKKIATSIGVPLAVLLDIDE